MRAALLVVMAMALLAACDRPPMPQIGEVQQQEGAPPPAPEGQKGGAAGEDGLPK